MFFIQIKLFKLLYYIKFFKNRFYLEYLKKRKKINILSKQFLYIVNINKLKNLIYKYISNLYIFSSNN